MTARPWTGREILLLKRDWQRRPTAEIALVLGRTVKAVRLQASALGLSRKKKPVSEKLVRRMHAAGESDDTIARVARCSHVTIGRIRRRLGLAVNHGRKKFSVNGLARLSRCRDEHAAEYGTWSKYILSRRRLRYLAQVPGCVSAAQVEICRLLAQHGPLTAEEVATLRKGDLGWNTKLLACLKKVRSVCAVQGEDGKSRYQVIVPVRPENGIDRCSESG